jgi:hypothetical protein
MITSGKTTFTDVVGESLMDASHAETLAGLAIEAVAAIVAGIGTLIRAVPVGSKENDDERL